MHQLQQLLQLSRERHVLLLLLIVLLLADLTSSFPNGDVYDSCGDMVPQHSNKKPNYAAPPYSIVVGNFPYSNIYLLNEPLSVTVRAWNSSYPFIGFMLQVRSARNFFSLPAKGYWVPAADGVSKTINCFKLNASALVQTDLWTLTNAKAFWVPTEPSNGPLVVYGTVVTSYSNFYVNIQSNSFTSRASTPRQRRPSLLALILLFFSGLILIHV